MMDFQAARYLIADEVPQQAGNDHPTAIPDGGVFKTRDGQINIQAASDHLFVRLCQALHCEHLQTDPRFIDQPSRSDNRAELHRLLGDYVIQFSSAEMIDLLAEVGVPCGPIYTVNQTFADPQVQSLQMAPEFDHSTLGPMRLLGQSINMSRTAEHIDSATPELGEHTDEIMVEIGYNTDQIAELRRDSII